MKNPCLLVFGADTLRRLILAVVLSLVPLTPLAQTPAESAPENKEMQGPALNTFGPQLLHNLGSIFTSKENLLPLAVGSGATAVSSIWDHDLQEHFQDPGRWETIGDVGQWMGSAAVLGGMSGVTLLAGYKTGNPRLQRTGYDLSQALILSQGLTQAMKFAIGRERPNGENHRSFPSGHSSGAFSVAVVLAHHYPKAAIPAFGAAGFVAFSRIVKNKHWLSDTVGGAALGIIVGMTVTREDLKLTVGRVTFSPHFPAGGGVGIQAFID